MMHKLKKNVVKNTVRYMIYVISVATACYGFWGCLFPDLTLVEGTYRIVAEEDYSDDGQEKADSVFEGEGVDAGAIGSYDKHMSTSDKEQLYADILGGKVKVTFCSKFFELFRVRRGQ